MNTERREHSENFVRVTVYYEDLNQVSYYERSAMTVSKSWVPELGKTLNKGARGLSAIPLSLAKYRKAAKW